MRKVWLSKGDFELYHQDINPVEYDYFRNHIGTFKRMWHDQTEEFWSVFLKTFDHFIWHYGVMRDFPMTVEETRGYIDEIMSYIRVQFVDGRVSTAKGLIMDCVVVTQNRNCIVLMDKGSYAQNPFYMKETREIFRKLFGGPDEQKTYLKLLCGLQVYIKFAGAVVIMLRRWLEADEIESEDESAKTDYLSNLRDQTGSSQVSVKERMLGESEVRKMIEEIEPGPNKGDKDVTQLNDCKEEAAKKKKKKRPKCLMESKNSKQVDTPTNQKTDTPPSKQADPPTKTATSDKQSVTVKASAAVKPVHPSPIVKPVDPSPIVKPVGPSPIDTASSMDKPSKDSSQKASSKDSSQKASSKDSSQKVKDSNDVFREAVSDLMSYYSRGPGSEMSLSDLEKTAPSVLEAACNKVMKAEPKAKIQEELITTRPGPTKDIIEKYLSNKEDHVTSKEDHVTSKEDHVTSSDDHVTSTAHVKDAAQSNAGNKDKKSETVSSVNGAPSKVYPNPSPPSECDPAGSMSQDTEGQEGLAAKKKLHTCHYCGMEETVAKNFKRCQKCRGRPNPSYYCSKECQVKHWKTHRLEHRAEPNVTG